MIHDNISLHIIVNHCLFILCNSLHIIYTYIYIYYIYNIYIYIYKYNIYIYVL